MMQERTEQEKISIANTLYSYFRNNKNYFPQKERLMLAMLHGITQVTDLTQTTRINPQDYYKHMQTLQNDGLIEIRINGRKHHYLTEAGIKYLNAKREELRQILLL